MDMTLFDLIRNYKSLSISGMCKNAGKTTALNTLINSSPDKEILALTSIGRDGEKTDTVTKTQKPDIYIREGSLFATAEQLLKFCDVTKEILDTTHISTPLGSVVLVRALSDGYVQLAGPSIIVQLVDISPYFWALGADRLIIDGSVGRKTLCTKLLADATILCTGASFSQSMEETILETQHTCRILMTPELPMLKSQISPIVPDTKYVILGKEKICLPDGAALHEHLKQTANPNYLYIEGALTDRFLDLLMRSGYPKGLTIVTHDASRLLISSDNLCKLNAIGGALGVLESINLAAITINPFSAYGQHYNSMEFKEKMTAAVPVPVLNVLEC
ncbi:MAG: hypothetical protein FWC75_07680 [Oscillospiraceae bacterium]|nr:hypothetical protein [Oscillospiraceae bacterium]